MITISAGLQASLNSPTQKLAMCVYMKRTDNVEFGFTEHDRDLVIGGKTYSAMTSFTRTDKNTQSDLSNDHLELMGMLRSPSITEEDMHKGLWDYAYTEVFLV